MEQPDIIGTPKTLFSSSVLDSVRQNIKDSKSLIIVTGFLTRGGWNLIRKEVLAAAKRKCLIRVFSDFRELNTDYSLLFRLNRELNKEGRNFYGMVFEDEEITMLHAKLFIFEKEEKKSVVIIGSSNLTYPALLSNLEACTVLTVSNDSEFYKSVARIIETLESGSHEPTKQEYLEYVRNRTEIEAARSALLAESKKQALVRKTGREIISEIKKFRSRIKHDFNDTQLLEAVRRALEKGKGRLPDRCGISISLFTKLVLANRNIFSNPDSFKLMLQIYGNILTYADTKRNLEKLLRDNLESYLHVEKSVVRKILLDSIPGRYDGLIRGVSEPFKIRQSHIKETVDLLHAFLNTDSYDDLLDRFIRFHRRTRCLQPRGIGLLTGIMSALRPNLFIVCNKRTRTLSRISKQYEKVLKNDSFENYPKFNEIFRYLGERTGLANLRELDLAASDIYEKLKEKQI